MPRQIKRNAIEINGDVAFVVIESKRYGQIKIIIDSEDVDKVKNINWSISNCGNGKFYAYSNGVFMHRLLMNTPKEFVNDHKNHNTFDNTKLNIPIVTRSKNSQNRKEGDKTGRKYKTPRNVYFKKQTGRYGVSLQVEGKEIHIGYFENMAIAEQNAIAARERYMPYVS